MNRNRRDQHRATFGQAWQLRITRDFLDTFTRIIQAIRKAVRAALGQPPAAPQLHTCTTTAQNAPEPPSSHTAPTGGFTEAPGWRAQPGFSVDTPPPDHPAVLFSLSLDVEINSQEDS